MESALGSAYHGLLYVLQEAEQVSHTFRLSILNVFFSIHAEWEGTHSEKELV